MDIKLDVLRKRGYEVDLHICWLEEIKVSWVAVVTTTNRPQSLFNRTF